MSQGVDYYRIVKTVNKGSCLATLENLMKDWPGGSYLVMKSTQIFPGGRPLVSIGYRYNSRKVLGFIASEGVRSIKQGDTCLSLFPDIFRIFPFAPLSILTC